MNNWNVTTNLQTALTNNYIGEVEIRLNSIINGLYEFYLGKKTPPIVFYYYGKPDVQLKERFGYTKRND